MISPETLEMIQKGGMLLMALMAIGGLLWDRNRLLVSLSAKDDLIAKKDTQLLDVTKQTIMVMMELKGLLGGRGAGI